MKEDFGRTVGEWDNVGALCIAQKCSALLILVYIYIHCQCALTKGSSTLIASVMHSLKCTIQVKQLEWRVLGIARWQVGLCSCCTVSEAHMIRGVLHDMWPAGQELLTISAQIYLMFINV